MSTVIAGVRDGDGDGDGWLSEGGAVEFNERLCEEMERHFPGTHFVVVPGGETNGEWNRLVRGNSYHEPTPEQAAIAEMVSDELWLTQDPRWWVELVEAPVDEAPVDEAVLDKLTQQGCLAAAEAYSEGYGRFTSSNDLIITLVRAAIRSLIATRLVTPLPA